MAAGAAAGFEASKYPKNEDLEDWQRYPRSQQELYYETGMPPAIIKNAETYDPWRNMNNENTGRTGVPPVPTYTKENIDTENVWQKLLEKVKHLQNISKQASKSENNASVNAAQVHEAAHRKEQNFPEGYEAFSKLGR